MVRPSAWALAATLGMIGVVAYPLAPAGSVAASALYVSVGVACNLAVVAGVCRYRPARRTPWFWLAGGLALSNVGNVLWFAERARLLPAWCATFADGFYLACFLAFTIAVFRLIRGRTSGRDRAGLLDALIVSTGLALLSWAFLMRPIVLDTTLSIGQRLVNLAYPAADVLLIAMLARLLSTAGARAVSFRLLVTGLLVQLGTDTVYVVQTVHGSYTGGVVDAGWLLTYVLAAAAALHPSMCLVSDVAPERPPRMTRWRFALLAGASLLAPAVLAFQGATDPGHIDWPALALGSVTLFGLVLVRMWHLIAQVQDQAIRLKALAGNDALTGAPNRRAWDVALPRAIATARRTGTSLYVGLLDLDHFKRYNDTYGHLAGDSLLRQAVGVWLAQLRETDLLARYGGEEFAVLLADATPAEALAIVERVRAATPGGQTISAGLTPWDGTETAEQLLNRADQVLYQAKHDGRNRVQFALSTAMTLHDDPEPLISTALVDNTTPTPTPTPDTLHHADR